MRRTIWKFGVPIGMRALTAVGPTPIPGDGIARHVGEDPQSGDPAVWWEIDPSEESKDRRIVALATDQDIPPGAIYLGTAICGVVVWHVFELTADG